MKRKIATLFGVASGAALFMLFQGDLFAAQLEGPPAAASQSDSAQTALKQKAAEAVPPVRIRLDKTSIDNDGTINLSGTAPPGKPVYVEVWAEQKVRASRFDTKPDVVVGSSLLAIFFDTVMGTIRHFQFGHFDVIFFLIMFPGAIPGGFIGPKIAKRLSPLMVKRIAVVGLLILGVRLLAVS
jgi:Sulfite exporter TauE/SafE